MKLEKLSVKWSLERVGLMWVKGNGRIKQCKDNSRGICRKLQMQNRLADGLDHLT